MSSVQFNVGNLRYSDATRNFFGVDGADDRGFCKFLTLNFGVRAFVRNFFVQFLRWLKSKKGERFNSDGYRISSADLYQFIPSYINKFAPPSDGNDTQAYISGMITALDFALSEDAGLNKEHLIYLLSRQILIEKGGVYYDLYKGQINRYLRSHITSHLSKYGLKFNI